MSGPLTILHLTHDGRGAGSSISIALLARAQRELGHRVIVACPRGRWLEGLLADTGVGFAPIAFESRRRAAAAIEHLVKAQRVDVVNAHSSRDRAATRRLRLLGRLGAALVMTRRAMPMSSPASALLSGFTADRTIAVSRPVRRALIRRGTPPWRIRVVPNAVDLERVDRPVSDTEKVAALASVVAHAGAQGWAPEGGRPEGLGPMIGVVSRPKDHDTLVDGLRYLATPATLVCLGFVPVSPSRRRADGGRRVVWLPFQDDPFPFYKLFDVVALPTRYEGMSQGLLEAMALGKAIVTTRAGGNTDLIEHGVHGLLVPPGSPAAMGAAIQSLLDDPALRRRLGAAAQARVRREFTILQTVAATDAVYREALARR